MNHFRFQKIEGLSQNTVFKITQDGQGFLWVATGDGLNRYDGIGFKTYKPSVNEAGHITGRVIRSNMSEDNDGRLWLSTETGLQFLDKRRGRFHFLLPFNDSFNYMNGSLYPIEQIGENYWFGKTTQGILSYHLPSQRYTSYPFPGSAERPLQFLGEKAIPDGRGHLWSSQQAGLYCFDLASKKWGLFLANSKLSHSCLVNDILYLVSPEGVILFDTKEHSSRLIKTPWAGTNIRCLTSDGQGNVWAGDMYGNILKMDRQSSQLNTIANINGLRGASFPIYELCFDASGILWIGTDGMGLIKANVHSPDFFKFPGVDQLENLFIKSIYEDEAGIVWLGTFGRGILQLNPHTNTATGLDIAPFNKTGGILVSFIKEDQFKNLWVGYGERLYCRKFGDRIFSEVKLPMEGNKSRLMVSGMAQLRDKWIITTTLGVFNLYITANFSDLKIEPEPGLGDFSFIYPAGKEQFIVGFDESGLCLFSKQQNTWKYEKHLVEKMGFKCVYSDSLRQLLWFGTDRGLMAYNRLTETYRLFTEADGLGNSFVYGILESAGQLWLSTNGGLCNVKIGATKAGDFPAISCRNYKQKDGLQSDEFNTGAFLKSRNGMLYFAGINGVNWFSPSMIHGPARIGKLAITQFTVNNKPADSVLSSEYINEVKLDHTQNNLYLQFHALEFSNPSHIHYAYKLAGWDKDWVDSKTNNEVRYNNLLPGDYTFHVKASNADSSWMEKPYSIHIIIAPPFWKTWWFYLFELLFITAGITWLTHLVAQRKLKKEIEQLEQQKALFTERMRITQDMHDDIGAGLTQISLISESARLHSLPGSNIKNELDDISNTSRQLVDNIGEIIWSLNPQHNTLEILLAHLREQINKLAEYADINCTINFPPVLPEHTITNQQRRNTLLITREIVHNAIKYSQAKELKITLSVEQGCLLFSVSDNGIGFDINCASKGNGLRNMRQRIDEIGGSITICSVPGGGTQYSYDFPLH